MRYALRFTGEQHAQLQAHLFPGDGLEAAALVLCGRRNGDECHVFCARRIVLIPYDACKRTAISVDWPTKYADPLIAEAMKRSMAVVKIHSHPGGLEGFSPRDDQSDESFFRSVCGLLEDDMPHASAVLLPGAEGRIFARAILPDGKKPAVEIVSVAGNDLRFWFAEGGGHGLPEFVRRQAQAFGAGTVEILRRLTIAVIGCSGTGSPLIEQLVRLGVGCIILVDPDRVEWKNLSRIYLSRAADANLGRFKVNVLAEAIGNMGLATRVIPLPMDLDCPNAVKRVAEADVVIGCMDSWHGRDLLNRLATFYVQPYLDLGAQLTPLPLGGIDTIWGAVHYLQPGRSSMKSRGVYTSNDVRAELLRRDDPAEYSRRLREKYIRGVQEDRPAVISVNTLVAAVAVNELLARIHHYRIPPNEEFASQRIGLHEGLTFSETESNLQRCPVLSKKVGRGDVVPLLEKPEMTEGRDAA
jgi:molybdopterin/thiamine biosynthesis adenylyltransferase